MAKRFHKTEFDDGTQVKLAIFRGYIREWISVFLTEWKEGSNPNVINLWDFFAGPGTDAAGSPGSPRIIQDELKDYCQARDEIKARGLQVKLYFNDKSKKHIHQLQQCLTENACPKKCCEAIFSAKAFQESLTEHLPIMAKPRTANLVIMDQFGVKEVTPAVVKTLAGFRHTDILFFVSSSYIRRFAEEPSIQAYFRMSAEELVASEYKSIHRHICEYFRSALPSGSDYHLAPFSIKKGSNIYGVIFGSGNLLGLQKFLKVCWELDGITGEANYDIDDDPARFGQMSFLPEMNIIKKHDGFEHDLKEMLRKKIQVGIKSSPPSNLDVYRFTLERGFLPKHAREHMAKLQKAGQLEVQDPASDKPPKKGAFYLTWDNYKEANVQAVFRLKD